METFIKMEERTNTQQREMEEQMTKHQMEFEMKLRQLDAEREEKRRREERQFQLQMMQMQMQMFGGIVNQGFSGGYMNNHSVYNDNQAGPSSMPNAMPMQYQSTCTRDQYSTTPPYVQQGVQHTPNPYIQTNPTTDNDEQYDELKNFTVL